MTHPGQSDTYTAKIELELCASSCAEAERMAKDARFALQKHLGSRAYVFLSGLVRFKKAGCK